MIGNLDTQEHTVSNYKPTPAVTEFTAKVKQDYSTGHDILTQDWTELNNSSVIDDMNRGRMMFNAFVDDSYEDPNEAWKWRGTRSKARNKGIAMHANLTAAYILPSFQAQNSDDEVDKDFSEFMTDLVEWMASDENSNYKENFLSLVFAMESDPIVYLGAEYQEVMQTIKIKKEDGTYSKKEIMDEVLSGFKAPIYTADQILLSNAFERNLQKQKCIMKRKWIEYDDAKSKYGEHVNFEYVQAGFNTVYNADDGLFYDIKDDMHPTQVEEVTAMYRRDDTEVCFLGGIYMGDTNVENNPMKHRDNFGAPRYNLQQFGYYPIGSHFIFYKSMMNSMRWDNALYDASTEIIANRAILDAEMPLAISGTDSVDGEIIYPNAVVALSDKDSKISPLLPPSNLAPLMASLNQTDESISEGSVNETISGQLPAASQKAYNVAQSQAAARKVIGGVAKGLAASVAKYGLLMADIAVNHLTVPQVDELTGDGMKLKYRKFLLENKTVGGRRASKQLMFDEGLIGKEMTKAEKDKYNLNLLEKSGYPDNEKHLFVANPEMFAKMKYLSKSDYNELFPQDDSTMQALLQGLYGQLRQDPLLDAEALMRELMYSFFKTRGDKFVTKQKPNQPALPGAPQQPGALVEQAKQKQVAGALGGMV